MWSHFDTAFEHADRAFAEADKAFAEAERVLKETPNGQHTKTNNVHHLKFSAVTWRDRFRLARKFLGMGLAVLFKGKTQLNFKEK